MVANVAATSKDFCLISSPIANRHMGPIFFGQPKEFWTLCPAVTSDDSLGR